MGTLNMGVRWTMRFYHLSSGPSNLLYRELVMNYVAQVSSLALSFLHTSSLSKKPSKLGEPNSTPPLCCRRRA